MLEMVSIVVGMVLGTLMSLGLVKLITKNENNRIKVFLEKNGRHYKKIPKNLFIL